MILNMLQIVFFSSFSWSDYASRRASIHAIPALGTYIPLVCDTLISFDDNHDKCIDLTLRDEVANISTPLSIRA